jgi:hypothetical protein
MASVRQKIGIIGAGAVIPQSAVHCPAREGRGLETSEFLTTANTRRRKRSH